MKWTQLVVVLSLAVAALCFSSGCTDLAVDPDATILGEIAPGRLVLCADGEIQVYQVHPFAAGVMFPASSSLNGEDCSESAGDPFRPHTMSPPVTTSSPSTSLSAGEDGRRLAENARTAIQDQYGFLAPLPGQPFFARSGPRIQTACTPNTSIYMVNHRRSTVTRLNTCPLAVGRRITVGSNPLQVALTPDARTLLVTRFDNALVFVDTATDTVQHTMLLPGLFPNGVAVSPDGRLAYVTNFLDARSQLFVVDLAQRQIVGSVNLPNFPKSVFLTPDGSQAWVTHWRSSNISIVDTVSLTTSTQVNAGGTADNGLAFNPTGTRAYIAVRPNSLAVMDTATLTPVARITVGDGPGDVVVSPEGTLVIVKSTLSPTVSFVDARTNRVIASGSVRRAGGMGIMLFR